MFVRRRPLLRAAAVGGAGYVAGKRAMQRSEQEAEHNRQIQELQQQQAGQPQPPAPPPASQSTAGAAGAPAATQSTADRIAALSQLKELLDKGVLTQAEFDSEKAKLLQGG